MAVAAVVFPEPEGPSITIRRAWRQWLLKRCNAVGRSTGRRLGNGEELAIPCILSRLRALAKEIQTEKSSQNCGKYLDVE
jgi:hypothetical protein